MQWLELMRLSDGTRVEAGLPLEDPIPNPRGPWYRVRRPDGEVSEFNSMTSTLSFLKPGRRRSDQSSGPQRRSKSRHGGSES